MQQQKGIRACDPRQFSFQLHSYQQRSYRDPSSNSAVRFWINLKSISWSSIMLTGADLWVWHWKDNHLKRKRCLLWKECCLTGQNDQVTCGLNLRCDTQRQTMWQPIIKKMFGIWRMRDISLPPFLWTSFSSGVPSVFTHWNIGWISQQHLFHVKGVFWGVFLAPNQGSKERGCHMLYRL